MQCSAESATSMLPLHYDVSIFCSVLENKNLVEVLVFKFLSFRSENAMKKLLIAPPHWIVFEVNEDVVHTNDFTDVSQSLVYPGTWRMEFIFVCRFPSKQTVNRSTLISCLLLILQIGLLLVSSASMTLSIQHSKLRSLKSSPFFKVWSHTLLIIKEQNVISTQSDLLSMLRPWWMIRRRISKFSWKGCNGDAPFPSKQVQKTWLILMFQSASARLKFLWDHATEKALVIRLDRHETPNTINAHCCPDKKKNAAPLRLLIAFVQLIVLISNLHELKSKMFYTSSQNFIEIDMLWAKWYDFVIVTSFRKIPYAS